MDIFFKTSHVFVLFLIVTDHSQKSEKIQQLSKKTGFFFNQKTQ